MSHTNSILTINLKAIADNYRVLCNAAQGSVCAAVVKANAYGLGMLEVVPVLVAAGCKDFFVATLDEGVLLRGLLPAGNIYVLHGVQARQESYFIEYALIPVLNALYQAELWNEAAIAAEKTLPAVIHIDTGMCRLGLSKRAALNLAEHRETVCRLDIRYIMSHLACADEPDHYKNSRQYSNFLEIKKYAPATQLSLANSSGIFLGKKFHFDMVRPGAALYGINPTPYQASPMQTVVTLTSHILQIRNIDVMQTVGYGATYKAQPGGRIAVIPVGYAVGYLRSLGNKAYCRIAGYKVPVVGRVSMDLITVDASAVPEAVLQVGAEVELIGAHCSADEIAALAGSNAYELFTRLGSWFKREYI